jgi:muconolactone delta-isomerase
MKLAVIMDLKPGVTQEQVAPFLREEAAMAWQYHKEGFFRDMNFRTDRPGVLNILEAESIEAAGAKLQELPLAREGFMTLEIIPLGYPAFLENLFATPR